jgi:hypothetical protein
MLSRLINWEIRQASRFIPKDAPPPPPWTLNVAAGLMVLLIVGGIILNFN